MLDMIRLSLANTQLLQGRYGNWCWSLHFK